MDIGIVGLGLMGGSFGLAVKELDYIDNVYGYDHNKTHQKEAIEYNLVDEIIDYTKLIDCDIIILAIPVDGIIDFLVKLPKLKDAQLIIDLGSTKSKIVKNTPKYLKSNFVPAHPMTGTEKFGPTSAFSSLYRDKNVVLCDLDECGELQKDISIKLFEDLGMNITTMDSDSHDNHAAFISHMPHIVSFSLANSVMAQQDHSSILSLAAGGFKDMSRIAKSSPHMWRDISEQNRDNILESIEYFQKELNKAKRLIETNSFDELYEWMREANKLHDIL
jgi:prephenate dehydrogenase